MVSPEEYARHNPEMKAHIEKYSYRDEDGMRVISWDLAKYVNHCCQSNTLSAAYNFDIAVHDIQAGEEITCDYGMLNIEEAMPVICNKKGCRKMVLPYDFEYPELVAKWDEKVKSALAEFRAVEQPILKYLPEVSFDRFMNFLSGEQPYNSVTQLKLSKLEPNLSRAVYC